MGIPFRLGEIPRALVLLSVVVAGTLAGYHAGGLESYGGTVWAISSPSMPLVPVALGVALVISCGEIDLSVAGLFSFFGMLALRLAAYGWGPVYVFAAVYLSSVLIGASIAFLVAKRQMSSLVITLAVSFVFFGGALVLHEQLLDESEPWRQCNLDPDCSTEGEVAPITSKLPESHLTRLFEHSWVWAITLVVLLTTLRRTSRGLYHLATGLNRRASRLAAVPIDQVRFGAFLASSHLCFLSAMLSLIDFGNGYWSPNNGSGMELQSIAAAIIGGTAITGGTFSPVNVALAVALWSTIKQLTVWLPFVRPETQQIVIGLCVLLVAFLQARRRGANTDDV